MRALWLPWTRPASAGFGAPTGSGSDDSALEPYEPNSTLPCARTDSRSRKGADLEATRGFGGEVEKVAEFDR
jgi:hypothetical protein